jgi:hypothetical protein
MVAIIIVAVIMASGFIAGLTILPVGEGKHGTVTVTKLATTPVYLKGEVQAALKTVPTPAPIPSGMLDVVGRKIIYNAWISLEVQDVDGALGQLQAIAEEFGGYVAHMSVSKREVKTGSVTLRVPQADFYGVIERIERLGEVKDKNVKSEDVTERYIDLKARLENAQREEQRLLEFLEKAQNVDDLLNIERELSRVREKIEVYTGQLRYLESRVDYATITVTLSGPSPPKPLPEVDWDATVKTGLQYLLAILQGLIVLAFVAIPPVMVGVPIYYAYRRKHRKPGGVEK